MELEVSGGSSGSISTSDRVLAAKVISLARSEVNNGDRSGRKYIQKYNSFAGTSFSLSDPWCAMFVCYIMRAAGVDTTSFPNIAGCTTMMNYFAKQGRWVEASSGYLPNPGDVVLFEQNDNRDDGPDHVGIVDYANGSILRTYEGNELAACTYSLNGGKVQGYCIPNYNTSLARNYMGSTISSGSDTGSAHMVGEEVSKAIKIESNFLKFDGEYTPEQIQKALTNLYDNAPSVIKNRRDRLKKIVKNSEKLIQNTAIFERE